MFQTLLLLLPVFFPFIHGNIMSNPVAFGKKYPSTESNDGMRLVRQYPKHRMEVVLSFGATEEMVRVAEVAIEDNYSGIKSRMGEEVDEIGRVSRLSKENQTFQIMENFYGGAWSVAFFEDPSMFAYTIEKRSPSFLVFDVDSFGVSIAREGGTR